MYYGLFIKIGHRFIRVDTTTGYTEETAKIQFRHLIASLTEKGVKSVLRKLKPVKQISLKDRGYARTPW